MLRQLLKKELQLQRSNLLFVVALVAIWAVLVVLATQGQRELLPQRQLTLGLLVSLVQGFFIAPCLLVVIPLMVGAATMTEERRLGVWEWHLSFPVSRGLQWAVKLSVGAAITLGISLFLQPALDAVLSRILADRGNPLPLPSWLLAHNAGYFFLPLLLMVSGAFASCFTSEPYKAIFRGAVFFGFVLACLRLADPEWQLLLPWPMTAPFLWRLHLIPAAMVTALVAAMAWLGYFNFRYEAFRWRRLIIQLSTLGVLTFSGALLALKWEFGPGSLLARSIEESEWYVNAHGGFSSWDLGASASRQNANAPKGGKVLRSDSASWDAIEPLIAFRAKPIRLPLPSARPQTAASMIWEGFRQLAAPRSKISEYYDATTIRRYEGWWRLPGTNRILVEMSPPFRLSGGEGAYQSDLSLYSLFKDRPRQTIEVDVITKEIFPVVSPLGTVMQIFPENSSYLMRSGKGDPNSQGGASYLINRWPIPIRQGGLLSWLLSQQKQNPPFPYGPWGQAVRFEENFTITADGATSRLRMQPLGYAGQNYYRYHLNHEEWLLKCISPSNYVRVDMQRVPLDADPALSYQYIISPDGKWFTRSFYDLLSREPYGGFRHDSLDIFSMDHSTTWTISAEGGEVGMGIEGYPPSLDLNTEANALGDSRNFMLPISPSGRFLAFIRGKFNESTVSQANTGWIEFCVLDLQTGRQSLLRKIAGEDRVLQFDKFFAVPTMRSSYMECKTLWAKDRERLGVSLDRNIFLFDFPSDGSVSGKKVGGAAPLFIPVAEISLPKCNQFNFEYWDANTLLIKNFGGVYKIDIEKVRKEKTKP